MLCNKVLKRNNKEHQYQISVSHFTFPHFLCLLSKDGVRDRPNLQRSFMVHSSNQRPTTKPLQPSSNPIFLLLLRQNHALSATHRHVHEHQRHQRQPRFAFPDLHRASNVSRDPDLSQELGVRRNLVGHRVITEPWLAPRQRLHDKAGGFQKEQVQRTMSERALGDSEKKQFAERGYVLRVEDWKQRSYASSFGSPS